MAHKTDKKGIAKGGGKAVRGGREEEEEDYGDYVTRCICGYTHDDGFMVQCDDCSVWQHVECITVTPNNLPDKYLCELCQPRSVDKKRARQLQHKKREDISDLEESTKSPSSDSRTSVRKPPHPPVTKRRRKQSKDSDSKPSETKKTKKEKGGGYRKTTMGGKGRVGGSQGGGKMGSIQCLLNAATLLEGEKEVGKISTSSYSWKELWSADQSPWCDKYDTAEHNRYSDTVRQFVGSNYNQLKSEAVVFSQQEYSSMESHTHPQCRVTEVQRRRMGVVAQVEVPEDELVLEYKGKVADMSAVLADFPPGTRSLWKHRPCPFVYIYDKISGLDLCIDARLYGNLARFIRRSCTPNSELRHFFVHNELHFGVYATHTISVHEEITLPFDLHLEKCDYPLECGCGRKNCSVVRAARGRGRGRGEPTERVTTDNLEKMSQTSSRGSSKPHPLQHSPAVPPDEDSNSSWTSSSGRKKPRSHAHQSGVGTLISRGGAGGGGDGGSRQVSREVSSDSEDDTRDRKKKVKSREERKTEAVMKMFQRMEASSQRKRRHLTSEGSVDSDTLSPSTLHPHPLTPSQRASTLTERRSSTSSKKGNITPQTKMRLSSVSSNEGLSAADLPDAFSPPITPRVPLTSPHPLSSPLPTSPFSPSYTNSPTVKFTPDLHPKYLLAQFPMPLKKALLRQWESEKQGFSSNGKPRPLWPQDHMTITAGYITTSYPNGSTCKQRQRGCLKHRWLRQYCEETALEEKENKRINSTKMTAPLKRRILLQWQTNGVTDTTLHTPLVAPQTGKATPTQPKMKTSERHVGTVLDDGVTSSKEGEPRDTCQSPLFEEFSDNEFEVKETRTDSELEGEVERERERERERGARERERGGQNRDTNRAAETEGSLIGSDGQSTEIGEKTNTEERLNLVPRPQQVLAPPTAPPTPANISDISSDMEDSCTEKETSPTKPPPPPPDNPASISRESETVSSEAVAQEKGGDLKEHLKTDLRDKSVEVVRKPKSLEELMSEDLGSEVRPVGGGAGGRGEAEEDVMGVRREEGVGGRREGRVGKTLEELMVMDMAGGGEQSTEVGVTPRRGGGEGEGGISSVTPDPRDLQTPDRKTPVKRKINLSEYRSRIRKPAAEQRKDFSDHPSSSPQHTSTFHPPSFTPSHLTSSSYSLLTTSTNPTGTLLAGGVATSAPPPPPQFEPVSPDDSDPPPIHSEGPAHSQQQGAVTMPGHIPLGVLPRLGETHQPGSTFIPPGSHTTTYGMEPIWNAPQLEPSQDPRRHMMGGGLLPHPQPHLQPHPGTPSHVMMSQPCPSPSGELMTHPPEYPSHQPHPPHGYGLTHRPPMFPPCHPPGGSSTGFY